MNEFKLNKRRFRIRWNKPRSTWQSLQLIHDEKTPVDALLIVIESYTHVGGLTQSKKEVWHFLTPEELDALSAAAAIMAKDIRSARGCKAGGETERELLSASFPQHAGELPHGVGCPACRRLHECNECGRAFTHVVGGRESRVGLGCTNGRCSSCCYTICEHAEVLTK